MEIYKLIKKYIPIKDFNIKRKIAKLIKADVTAEQLSKILGYKDCGCSKRQEALNNPELLVNKVFYNNNENKSSDG